MATQLEWRAHGLSHDYGEETEGTQRRRLPSRSLRDVVSQAPSKWSTQGGLGVAQLRVSGNSICWYTENFHPQKAVPRRNQYSSGLMLRPNSRTKIYTKALKVFLLAIHSHLYSFASRFYFFKTMWRISSNSRHLLLISCNSHNLFYISIGCLNLASVQYLSVQFSRLRPNQTLVS